MQLVVLGATGNVGTALLDALATEPGVAGVRAVSRRPVTPDEATRRWSPIVQPVAADILTSDLRPVVRGADVVIHVAWALQPMHDAGETWRTNVDGMHRILDAVVAERVPALVYSSSLGTYTATGSDVPVGEDAATTGLGGVPYAMEKAYIERLLDGVERSQPWCRIVRLRPALVLQRAAGREYESFFLGGPAAAALRALVAARAPLPLPADLRFQVVHASDVAHAIVTACRTDVRGAFNLAADPVIRGDDLADAFGVRTVRAPWWLLREADRLAFLSRIAPLHPGWIEMIRRLPLMDSAAAAEQLGWTAQVDARTALRDAVTGLLGRESRPTARLDG